MVNGDATVKVMVVDDQEPFRDAVRAVVSRLDGFDLAAEACSGEDAVTLAAALRPDLVFMDINMGAMNGIEATRRIRADDPEVVVILMSTYELADLPPDAHRSGASAYVNKDDLSLRTVRRIWENRGDPAFDSDR